MSGYIDLNYEEISCDRVITDENFANGLQNFRWSVSPAGGGCVVPHMSYFLVEYNFGAYGGNAYTATEALEQSKKITLQNNFMATMYNAARFTIAQSEISIVNSSHAQAHTLMRRLGYDTTFFEDLGNDMNGFDPDFSRRLARVSKDGVYHRDGLIDCSPYESEPIGALNLGTVSLYFQTQDDLTRDPTNTYFLGTGLTDFGAAAGGQFGFMSTTADLNIGAGTGGVPTTTSDANLRTTTVNSINYIAPDYSYTPGTQAQNATAIDGTLILEGDEISIYFGDATAEQKLLGSKVFRVVKNDPVGSKMSLALKVLGGVDAYTVKKVYNDGTPAPIPDTGFRIVRRSGANQYNQADPRSNVVNNVVAYQPPVSFFKTKDYNALFGDMEISLTPNANWRQSAIESSRGLGVNGYYGSDVQHGVDFAFGIKSMRLYLARAKMIEKPPQSLTYHVEDIQIMNKQLTSGSSVINFNIPPSTQRIAVWIQDSAVGTHSMLPLTRFKARQYTGGNLNTLNKFGPWSHDYSENLKSLQLNFAGITKPMTNFQRGSGAGSIGDGKTNNMLQRWIMTNQNNHNKRRPEKYTDWLSMGPYYLYDFTRSADNLGTYLTVNINYEGAQPTRGNDASDVTASNINLFVAALYVRDVALNYGPMGNVLSAQTQMA